ncbi:MAG: cytochrome [Gammaproteobacteria bacterium]|nr:cytochrome [Gammaproteobacteria bacterium]|tara:strand:- start:6577 stop:7842 length:1266 start_codon:yes stop_codon:yes gene_type:complete
MSAETLAAGQSPSDFSYVDPDVNSNPWAFFESVQRECPVYQIPETGTFIVTKYEDLRHVLRNHEIFSSTVTASATGGDQDIGQKIIREGGGWDPVSTLQRTDPPVHGRYRKLLDRVFTIKRVREMTPYIDQVSNDLIDSWIDAGECEFNNDFAMPMPGIIIAEQLGLGRDEVARFKRWADAMLGVGSSGMPTEDDIRANAETELEAQLYLAEVFEDRRQNPKDDLMSALVHAHGDDEEPLTMQELQSLMHQLITGGFETTQSAIDHGMWTLVRFPELVTRLRENDALIKPFIEEVLRWESPVQFLARRTTQDVELSGTLIPENSMVMVGYAPANRDADKFACPHQFDMERKNVGAHLAFGSGAHFCVGALLARQEMISAFRLLVSRLDNIQLSRPLPTPVHHFSMFFQPMHDFHIAFDRAS